jgi:hypothetical protein
MNPNDSCSTGNDAVWDDLEKMNDDVSEKKLAVERIQYARANLTILIFFYHGFVFYSIALAF